MRVRLGVCVVHGIKLCEEAHRQGAEIAELWMTKESVTDSRAAPLCAAAKEVFVMSKDVRDKLTWHKSPQDLLAVVAIPKQADEDAVLSKHRLLLLCGIQDPLNIGAIMRSAAAFGYGVLVDLSCADPWSPKSLRAGMGAQFWLRLRKKESAEEMIKKLQAAGQTVLAAALPGKARRGVFSVYLPKITLVIGNEGAGLNASVLSACDGTVTIPISEKVESLNAAVAASVLMWEYRYAEE